MIIINYLKSYFLVIVPKNLYLLEYIIKVAIIFYTIVCIKFHDINSKFVVR
jgi:hypothetical protein